MGPLINEQAVEEMQKPWPRRGKKEAKSFMAANGSMGRSIRAAAMCVPA